MADYLNGMDLFNYYNTKRLLVNTDFAVKGIPYIFFSTPMMNMDSNNCMADGFMSYMMSHHSDILAMLSYGSGTGEDSMSTTSPFIKLLTNTAGSFEPKDASSKTKEVGENFIGYKIMLPASNVDSIVGDEFSIKFRDLSDLPVLKLFNAWFVYHNNVRRGIFSPIQDAITNHYLDYTSSVYYFVTSMDGETLQYWCKYTGVVPINVPFSVFSSEWNNHDLIEYNVNFLYSFKEDMNPDILLDFNKLSSGKGLEINYTQPTTGNIKTGTIAPTGDFVTTPYEESPKSSVEIVLASKQTTTGADGIPRFKIKFA